jgi:adenylosuccinate synthase
LAKQIILLSGPVNAGKSTLGTTLVERYGFTHVKTHELIKLAVPSVRATRGAMQLAGEKLDRITEGGWVADAVARRAMALPEDTVLVVDAVRIKEQIDKAREAFGQRVVHIHLTAPTEDLKERYANRNSRIKEFHSYAQVRRNQTERNVDDLAKFADIVIDTRRSSPEAVVVRVAARLGLYGRGYDRLVDVLVGGQFGSEGKGNIASYIADEYQVLVRVGGPNAGHKVYEKNKPYTFHILPSGTRRNRTAKVVLGPGSVLAVPVLSKEVAECEMSSDRLSIDPQAIVIDEKDIAAEKTLTAAIGSTGQGVGVATARKVLRTNAAPPVVLAKDVKELAPYVRETRRVLDDAFAAGSKILLEGTQGTGLSLHHGSYPHVTSRDTTVSGCLAEAGIAPSRVRRIVMVCRTYPIRVESPAQGDSGPMTNEIDLQAIAKRSRIPLEELQKTERTSTTNKRRRISEFDWALLRAAASLNGPTDVALTFVDYVSIDNRNARRFEQLTTETINFIEEIERVARAPVSLIATRFHFRSVIDRRAW